MQFKKLSEKKTIRSKDSFNLKWTGSATLRATNLGNSYIIKVLTVINSSSGINLGNFGIYYLKKGTWRYLADGYDINNDIMDKYKMHTYDSIELAYEHWFNLCIDYVKDIEDGL